MKKTYLVGMGLFFLIFISACNIKVSNNPYVKEAYAEPSYIDASSDTSKVIYTITNPSQIDFKGKIVPDFNKECFTFYPDSQQIEVKAGSDKAGILSVRKNYNPKPECYKDQEIVLRLSNEGGSLIYNSKSLTIKLIGN